MDRMSVTELQRHLHRLSDFDIIELVDKKRGEVKGYILHRRYKPLIDSLTKKPAYTLGGTLKKYARPDLRRRELRWTKERGW